jgi:hypothetical protein
VAKALSMAFVGFPQTTSSNQKQKQKPKPRKKLSTQRAMPKPVPLQVGDTVYARYFGDRPMIIGYIKTATKTSVFPSGKSHHFSYEIYGCSFVSEFSRDTKTLEFSRSHLSRSPLAGEIGDGNHRQLEIKI